MTISIEIDGIKVEAENEKAARKALTKLARERRAAEAKQLAAYQGARLKAEAAAYRVMSRHAEDGCPTGWRFYSPSADWSKHLFAQSTENAWTHAIHTEARRGVQVDHYGHAFVGGVSNGAGYCFLIVLRDDRDEKQLDAVYAIGVQDDAHAIVPVVGVPLDWFATSAAD